MAYIEITYDDGSSGRWGDVPEDIAENIEDIVNVLAGPPDTIKA
jgi:hypothetical protein